MPYDAQAYQNWLGPAQPTYQARGNRMIGGQGGQTQYQYSGDNAGGYVRQNAQNDLTKPGANNAMLFASMGVSQIPRAYLGQKAFKRAQGMERADRQKWEDSGRAMVAKAPTEYLNAIDPTSQTYQAARQRSVGGPGNAMTADEIQSSLRQEEQGRQRSGFAQQVNDYFGGTERAGWQQSIVSNRLNNDLANVQEDYGNNLKSAVQGAASRGLKGGSIDVENRGAVARTRDTGAIQAASSADAASAAFKGQDQQAKGQLLGLVNSQDIGNAGALRAALENINSQTVQQGQQYAAGQQQRQRDQFGQQQQSQAWGGGLNGLASAVRASPNGNPFSYGSSSRGGW